eukprot:EG_transcript_2367
MSAVSLITQPLFLGFGFSCLLLTAVVAKVRQWVAALFHGPSAATAHEAMRLELEGLLGQLEASLADKSEVGRRNSAAILQQVRTQINNTPQFDLPTSDLYSQIRAEVLTSHAVTGAANYDPQTARRLFDGMAARPTPGLVAVIMRFFRWSAAQLFPLGIRVNVAELEKAKAIMATRPGPIIMLPTHKSHMDYLTVHYVCAMYGLPLPCAVAGDNLNVPVIGAILRGCGAIFIRRSFGGDALYTAVFAEYLRQLLRHGQALECFIEGARSRSGKLLPPKLGFLKHVVEAVDRDGDAWLLPISLGYDRIMETESYIDELQGNPKKAERLSTILHTYWHLMCSAFKQVVCYGRVDVGFGQPISIRDHLKVWQQKVSSETLFWNFETNALETKLRLPGEHNRAMLLSLAYQVLSQCNACSTILPTALVGTILLSHTDRGLHFDDLVRKVRWLQREVQARGGKVLEEAVLLESVSMVVNRIMSSAGRTNLVKRHRDLLITALFSPEERLELSLYRNQLMHIFILESITGVAASCIVREKGRVFSRQDVLEKVAFLSFLLKSEFTYESIFRERPGHATDAILSSNFNKIVARFLERGMFSDEGDGLLALRWDSEQGKSTIDYLCCILLPFVDSYFLVVLGCFQLLPDATATEKEFIAQVQLLGERLYFCGQLDYYESIGRETLQNAVQRYHQVGVLQYVEVFAGRPKERTLRLAPRFQNEATLRGLLQQMHQYRMPLNPRQSCLADLIAQLPRPTCS